MSRRCGTAAAVLSTLLVVGCAPDAPEPEGTDSTTRSLLTQTTAGGPSSPSEGDAELARRATGAAIPELGYDLGSPDAPLKLIEFADFGCGYCRLFHQETLPTLLEQFVDTDMIEWKLMPFVSGQFQNSLVITEGAECTLEQDASAFEALSERIWANQPEWKPSDDPETLVRSWAADLGVDMTEYDACLAEDRRIARIADATALARQLGVRGTPTFWVVGFGPLQGALPLDVFQSVLTAVLEEVESDTTN